jgi:uncharacterized membrane protein YqaE (UPF0057 family)
MFGLQMFNCGRGEAWRFLSPWRTPPYARRARFGALRMDLIRILFSILLPPVGVFLQVGIGKHFWLNIILTILGYIPGIVHAVYIIAK